MEAYLGLIWQPGVGWAAFEAFDLCHPRPASRSPLNFSSLSLLGTTNSPSRWQTDLGRKHAPFFRHLMAPVLRPVSRSSAFLAEARLSNRFELRLDDDWTKPLTQPQDVAKHKSWSIGLPVSPQPTSSLS